MVDSLGYRMKFGVIAPSTNTSVQPEFDWMRPVGVTNHFSRITIPDDPVHSDEDYFQLIVNIRETMMEAVDSVMSCSPGALVMGMSAETFWLDKPVIAINTATYWHALRQNGINDRIQGFGSLLADH